MNPSKRVSVEPSVEPTMGLSTQPSVNPSTKSSMHPSEKVSFNPSVELSTFTFNGSQVISKAQDYYDYAGLIAKPSTDYILRFTIEPYGLLNEWTSIIHIGEMGDNIAWGVPAVGFQPDTTKLLVEAGGSEDYENFWSSKQLAIKTESKIEIRVVGKYFKLSINGVVDSTMTLERTAFAAECQGFPKYTLTFDRRERSLIVIVESTTPLIESLKYFPTTRISILDSVLMASCLEDQKFS